MTIIYTSEMGKLDVDDLRLRYALNSWEQLNQEQSIFKIFPTLEFLVTPSGPCNPHIRNLFLDAQDQKPVAVLRIEPQNYPYAVCHGRGTDPYVVDLGYYGHSGGWDWFSLIDEEHSFLNISTPYFNDTFLEEVVAQSQFLKTGFKSTSDDDIRIEDTQESVITKQISSIEEEHLLPFAHQLLVYIGKVRAQKSPVTIYSGEKVRKIAVSLIENSLTVEKFREELMGLYKIELGDT